MSNSPSVRKAIDLTLQELVHMPTEEFRRLMREAENPQSEEEPVLVFDTVSMLRES